MKISVVIATYNRRESLRRCLQAITGQELAASEIIVVDDASNDGTRTMVSQEFPGVRYIRLEENRGPAVARNCGIFAAEGDIVAFTDDDCSPPTDWLRKLADGFARYPDVAGVGGYQEAPEALLRTSAIADAEHVMRLKRWGKRAFSEQIGGLEVPGLGTNNVAYRRNVLLKLGGFDEAFPVAAGEDADLKLRIAQQGYRLLYLPVKVEHYRAYTLSHQWHASVRRGIGAFYYETKHGRLPGLARVLMRFGKRTLLLFPDLVRYRWNVAVVLLITRIADAYGQLIMIRRAKAGRSNSI